MEAIDWKSSSVLVTGGTGSFGKKFTEVVLTDLRPRRLIIFSRDELKQHEMRTRGFDHPSLRYFIGDVRDSDRLRRAMHGVDIVVHTAALKQVPACEYIPVGLFRYPLPAVGEGWGEGNLRVPGTLGVRCGGAHFTLTLALPSREREQK